MAMAAAIVCATAFYAMAKDDGMTTLELRENCMSKNAGLDLSCSAFIAGLMRGLAMAHFLDKEGVKYCPPNNLNGSQARLIVEKFMAEHPEKLNIDPGTFAANALYAAFPCRKSN